MKSMRMSIAVVLAGAAPAFAQYSLVFEDEFEGAVIDTLVWEHQIGDGTGYGLPAGWGNNELQYYTPYTYNSYVQNGLLHIVARDLPIEGYAYSSARLRTQGAFEFRYGRVEARIKVPKGQGLWAAFWMLPTNSPYGEWAASGEIDIIETVNQATSAHGTIHHGGNWPNNVQHSGSLSGTDFSQDFHVYATEWTPDWIRWFVDGQEYYSVSSSTWYSTAAPTNPRAPFDTPFHLLLNLAVGGNWPGDPNGSTAFPADLQVDWVRVYRVEQQAFGGQPAPVPGRIEAEDFDVGYPGEAYQDCDAGNNGSSYRSDVDVDIQPCSEGGYNVGWLCQGEWLEYAVEVAHAGTHDLSVRVASNTTGGTIGFEIDGLPVSGTLTVPVTGGWQNWTTISGWADLPAGEHVMRLANRSGSSQAFNINYFELTGRNCNQADFAGPFGTLDFFDVQAFLAAFAAQASGADLTGEGEFNFFDVQEFLAAFAAGCP
ncbi:MAG: hypothetical protein DYG94_03610 [Leptolyngbya sp. PLA3]|nr:MAG: glycosyl hydrolase family protein [Cyanobacteria bacterium CYA]MCE7967816.1 hypothetical protein [Leptolyngbya sp. PL-A3]